METVPNLDHLSLNKICRVCLSESSQMYSIYSELYEDSLEAGIGTIPCIYEILISVSSIRIQADDGLPSMICGKCIDMAHTSFKFQKRCNQSQVILDAFLKQCSELKDDSAADLGTLDQINKTDLLVQTEEPKLDPNDFLSMEYDVVTRKIESVKEAVTVAEEVKALVADDIQEGGGDSDTLEQLENPDSVKVPDVKAVLPQEKKVKVKEVKEAAKEPDVYACSECSKVYKYSSSLRVHMRNHTLEKPYDCKTCGKRFAQYSSLIYHKRSHTGEQPYACSVCGKRYRQSGTLTAHMRVHTGQKPFLCSTCGRGFRQAPDLTYHMRYHTKEKPYMCSVCGKTMSMQSHLVQHMRTHTGEKPFKCNICEKAFPSSTMLKRHAIIHTTLRPYSCDVCLKSFNRRNSVKVHMKIHTDERAHVCPICSKGFIQAHNLRSHLLTHSSAVIRENATAHVKIT